MAGNGSELNINAVGVQNGTVPQVDVVAADDVQNVVISQADSPAACCIQNAFVPQVDFVVVAQYEGIPQVDVAGIPNNVVPQVDAPTAGGIQNNDIPQVDVIATGDQNYIVSQVDQNDAIQQAATDVESVKSSDDEEMYEVEELENFFPEKPHPTKKHYCRPVVLSSSNYNWEVYKQYVHRATTDVMSMIHMGEPLWLKKSDEEEVLNLKYYPRMSAHGLVESEVEFVTKATRASGIVCINGLALVEIMMNVVCFLAYKKFY
ncbi:hypothetical protein LINPERPRIM_LOCUS6882 [Linum perenne]